VYVCLMWKAIGRTAAFSLLEKKLSRAFYTRVCVCCVCVLRVCVCLCVYVCVFCVSVLVFVCMYVCMYVCRVILINVLTTPVCVYAS